MKKLLLVCLALLCLQGVCFAKIEKQVDDFDGSYAYVVRYSLSDVATSYLGSSFIVFFNADGAYDGKGFGISFTESKGYYIDDTIKMRIDNTVYTWKTESDSVRSAFVRRSFPIPENVFEALMNTKSDVLVRFSFKSLSGALRKDYAIPYKTIKETQSMFSMYVPQAELPKQVAK